MSCANNRKTGEWLCVGSHHASLSTANTLYHDLRDEHRKVASSYVRGLVGQLSYFDSRLLGAPCYELCDQHRKLTCPRYILNLDGNELIGFVVMYI